MNKRILKKILQHPEHPAHDAAVAQVNERLLRYARGECVRLGLDPEKWGSYALRWSRRILRHAVLIKTK